MLKTGLLVLLVVMITSLGVALRLYAAPRLSIDVDERVYLQAALQYADDIRDGQWKMLVYEGYNSEHPPFYKMVYGLALLTQPRLDHVDQADFTDGMAMYKVDDRQWGIAARYVSVIFGGLTTLVLALISPAAGLVYAIDTLAVQYNSSLFLEALPVLTSLLCALCYLHWREQVYQKSRPAGEHVLWLGLSAGFLGMSAASKYTYAVVGITIVIHFAGSVLKNRRAKDLWMLAAWGGLALLAFYICDPYLWKHPIEHLLGSLTFHMNHTQSGKAAVANLPFYQPFVWFSRPFYKFPGNATAIFPIKLDTLIGLLALAGLPRLTVRRPFYLVWLVTGFMVLIVWPTKWPQYGMMVMAPWCVSASAGAAWLVDELKHWLRRWQGRQSKAVPAQLPAGEPLRPLALQPRTVAGAKSRMESRKRNHSVK